MTSIPTPRIKPSNMHDDPKHLATGEIEFSAKGEPTWELLGFHLEDERRRARFFGQFSTRGKSETTVVCLVVVRYTYDDAFDHRACMYLEGQKGSGGCCYCCCWTSEERSVSLFF